MSKPEPAIPNKTFYLSHPEIKDLKPGDEFTIKARVETVHSTESTDSDREHCSIDAEIISINGNKISSKEEKESKKSREDEVDEELDKAIEETKYSKDDDED